VVEGGRAADQLVLPHPARNPLPSVAELLVERDSGTISSTISSQIAAEQVDRSVTQSSVAQRWSWFEWASVILVCGYWSMTRSFAHLGIAPLYVGEAFLLAVAVFRSSALQGVWIHHLTKRTPMTALSVLLTVSLCFGVLQSLRGIIEQHNTKIALQNLAFHVYPLFFFPGMYLGVCRPDMLPRAARWAAWTVGIYGAAYIAILSPLGLAEGGALVGDDENAVAWAGQPSGAGPALLAVAAFAPSAARAAIPLALNAFVVLGIQVRAIWMALAAAFPLWGFLTGKLRVVLAAAATATVLLAVAWVLDVRIPAPTGRGGEISARGIVGRALSAVSPELAQQYIPDPERYATTVSWRTQWWRALWQVVHRDQWWILVGPGYGYPIWSHHPEGDFDVPLRTPHNVFVYALSYTGWVGVALFAAVQAALAAVLWKAYRVSGQPFGFCYWVIVIIWATFDNFLESPQGAVPFYLLAGMAAAAVLRPLSPRDRTNEPARLSSSSEANESPGGDSHRREQRS